MFLAVHRAPFCKPRSVSTPHSEAKYVHWAAAEIYSAACRAKAGQLHPARRAEKNEHEKTTAWETGEGFYVAVSVEWEIKGTEFANCNCIYACPCQFNALPDKGFCEAVAGYQINQGHFGDVRLDGLRAVAMWHLAGRGA